MISHLSKFSRPDLLHLENHDEKLGQVVINRKKDREGYYFLIS